MDASSIMKFEGRFSWTYAFFCLLAINFVLWANKAGAIRIVEIGIALNAFSFVVKVGFQKRTGTFLSLYIHLKAFRTSHANESIIVPKIWLRA